MNSLTCIGFLIILLSATIYTPPHLLAKTRNIPLEHLTHSLERRLVLSLLCSFLNTSLASSKTSAGISGQIPYNHLISTAAEERRTLVRGCLTILLVALDYKSPEGDQAPQMGESKDENAFRYFISKLVSWPNRRLFIDGGSIAKRILQLCSEESRGYWRRIWQCRMGICQEARNPFRTC